MMSKIFQYPDTRQQLLMVVRVLGIFITGYFHYWVFSLLGIFITGFFHWVLTNPSLKSSVKLLVSSSYIQWTQHEPSQTEAWPFARRCRAANASDFIVNLPIL